MLDPRDVSGNLANNSWTPDIPIPPRLRRFGYYIAHNSLQPGDLILFSSINPGWIPRMIRKVQARGGYDNLDAQWEHAAVYIGNHGICEATKKGVEANRIFDYIGSHLIKVRRNPNLTLDQGWKLVTHALLLKDYRYGFFSVAELFIKANSGFWSQDGKPLSFPKSSVFCSELYADAHVKACNMALGNLMSGEVTPASLSLDTNLVDVSLSWVRIS